jgi:hypothetical protein
VATGNHVSHFVVNANYANYADFVVNGAVPLSGILTVKVPYFKVDSCTSSLKMVTPDDWYPMDLQGDQYYYGPSFRTWVLEKLGTDDVIYHPTRFDGMPTPLVISKKSLTQTATVSVTASTSVTALVQTSIYINSQQIPQEFTYYFDLLPDYYTFADPDDYLLEDAYGNTYPDYWLRKPKLNYSIASDPAIDLSILSNTWQPLGPSGPTVTNDWIESLSYGEYAAVGQKEGTSASITFSYIADPIETYADWDAWTKEPINPITLQFLGAYIIVGCGASVGSIKYIKNTV